MTVLELSKILGEAIHESEELTAYFAAKADYESDAALQEKLFEYETQRKILGQEFEKEPDAQNPTLISAIRDRIQTLAEQIVASPVYKNHEDAKNRVNDLMAKVNSEISFYVFGKRPSSCTHDCSTCSGCSSQQ